MSGTKQYETETLSQTNRSYNNILGVYVDNMKNYRIVNFSYVLFLL